MCPCSVPPPPPSPPPSEEGGEGGEEGERGEKEEEDLDDLIENGGVEEEEEEEEREEGEEGMWEERFKTYTDSKPYGRHCSLLAWARASYLCVDDRIILLSLCVYG